ncbi:hypothetical protein [Maridesulfovibrio sp.]|uniref:hypothetical protein n=1 Tax=Maridesulfovibrio sp. TaxID=2795000 RepID=UPI002A18815B|nr:hypothetical protein [Maridesulfovibrio sp.]
MDDNKKKDNLEYAAAPRNDKEFEKHCLEIIEDWTAKYHPGKKFKIKNATPSPVDIVLIEDNGEPDFTENLNGEVYTYGLKNEFKNAYFIECKFYSRKIELDKLAKSILVAIRHKPQSLTLGTRTHLSSQAEEYLSFFTGSRLFWGNTDFHIWLPLSDKSGVHLPDILAAESEDPTLSGTYDVVHYSLYVEDVFYKINIDPHKGDDLSVNRTQHILFKALITPPTHTKIKRIDRAYLVVTSKAGDEVQSPLEIERLKGSTNLNLKTKIAGSQFAPDINYESCKLCLYSGKQHLEKIYLKPFPNVLTDKYFPVLPDFREKETSSAYERWKISGMPLTLVSGESGIGKSYFCKEICRKATIDGYTAIEVSMLGDVDIGFISALAWAVVSPDMQLILKKNKQTLKDFIKTWCIASSTEDIPEYEIEILTTLLTKGTIEEIASDALLENLSRMIVNKGIPIVFYAHDLHKTSPAVAGCLLKLIKGFSDTGWGRIKILLEQRFPAEQNNNLWEIIHANYGASIWDCDSVEPLSEQFVSRELEKLLLCSDAKNVAKKIAAKSGRDLQHLTVNLQTLLHRGAIELHAHPSSKKGCSAYAVSNLTNLDNCLSRIPSVRDNAIHNLLSETHDKLIAEGLNLGCYLLGLLAIIQLSPGVGLLSGLTGKSIAEMQDELDALVDEQFLVQRRDQYKFTHESYREAALPWLEKQSRIKSWIRNNATQPCAPVSFEECIVRGRIWRYLNSTSEAFEALNAAISFAGSSFIFKIDAHKEMHKLLKIDRDHGRHHEFFENFSAIGWYGHYTLPVTEQIALTDEAIEFHGSISILDYPDPYYKYKLSELHRINTWLHIQNLDQRNYLHSAEEALNSTTDIHEIGMMLNRYILICRNWGMYSCGIRGAMASIVLCDEVSHEKDSDLLSVNYAMSAPLIAESEFGREGRLSFTQAACDNPHASKRELAHAHLAHADSLTICGNLDDASSCLSFSKKVMEDLRMDSLSISYHQSLGMWLAAKEEWHIASDAFKRSLEKASWLGQRLEALKAGQNLLLAHVKNNSFAEAEKIYQIVLKQCVENLAEPEFKAVETLLNGMIDKSHELLRGQKLLKNDEEITTRIDSLAAKLGIQIPNNNKSCSSVFFTVLHNAKSLSIAFPEYFHFSDDFDNLLNHESHAGMVSRPVNGIFCEIMNRDNESYPFLVIV